MRINLVKGVLVVSALLLVAGCEQVQQARQEQEQKQQTFVQRVDIAHIWVTPGDPPAGKPFNVLGEVKYSEPFTPDAIDEAKIKDKLKKQAYEKWPDTLDALVDEKSEVSADGNTVSVSAKAIQYESSVDRTALHKMNEGIVASPTSN